MPFVNVSGVLECDALSRDLSSVRCVSPLLATRLKQTYKWQIEQMRLQVPDKYGQPGHVLVVVLPQLELLKLRTAWPNLVAQSRRQFQRAVAATLCILQVIILWEWFSVLVYTFDASCAQQTSLKIRIRIGHA